MGGNSLIMIKLVHHLIVTKSAADFESLVDLLESLGLQKNFISREGKESGLAIFPAPPQIQINVEHGANSRSNAAKLALGLSVSNPDTVYEIVKKKGFKIIADSSKPGPGISSRRFDVLLPNATRLRIFGWRTFVNVIDSQHVALEGSLGASGRRFGLVVSRFNSFITERLLAGALDALLRSGALHGAYNIVRVPGAFEIPSAARMLAETKIYDAIICLGCLIRGDTAHYDVIVNEVTRGIGQSAQETGIPHAFGVLTCDTLEQAIDRAGLKMGNKGFEAALAAIEMANLKQVFSGQSPVARKKQKQIPRRTAPRNDKMVKVRNDKGPKARKGKSKSVRTNTSKKRK